MIGSAASSHGRRYSVVLGYTAIALGLGMLSAGHYATALAGLALMGVGVGATVTATNIIFGTEYPERRGALLTRTNFFWGAGAVLAPQMAAIAERQGAVPLFLIAVALASLLLSVVFAPLLKRPAVAAASAMGDAGGRVGWHTFVLFSAMMFLYVGGETAIAGWIASYAHRFESLSLARSSMVVSVFWLALVGSRTLVPLLLRVFSETAVMSGGAITAIAALLLLLSPHSMAATLGIVIVLGCGCGPIFPLETSRLLARVGRSRQSGWIFAICGSGGAVVPWVTGLLSEQSGSLRMAFVVPLAAMAAVLTCALLEQGLPQPVPISVPDSQ
jgi:fucose permease